MRRRGEAERAGGRFGRMRVLRVVGVVLRGAVMLSGRSGREVVKRIMRVRGGMEGGGGVDDIVVVVVVCMSDAGWAERSFGDMDLSHDRGCQVRSTWSF